MAYHALYTLVNDFAIFVTLYVALSIVNFFLEVHGKSFEFHITHVFLTLLVLLVSHN